MKRLAAIVLGGGAVAPVIYLAVLAAKRGTVVLHGVAGTLLYSFAIAVIVAAAATALGFVTSRAVARSRYRGLWTAAAYLPFVISPVVLGALLLHVFLVLNLAGTTVGVMLAQLLVTHGLAVVLLVGVWTPHMHALAGASRTLGATPLQTWLRVLVPAASPMLRLCFFQTFVIAWMQYGVTLLIGGGQVKTLPLLVFGFVTEADPSLGAAAALALILPPLLFWKLGTHVTR